MEDDPAYAGGGGAVVVAVTRVARRAAEPDPVRGIEGYRARRAVARAGPGDLESGAHRARIAGGVRIDRRVARRPEAHHAARCVGRIGQQEPVAPHRVIGGEHRGGHREDGGGRATNGSNHELHS